MRSMVEGGTRRGRNFRNVEASRTARAPSTTLLRKAVPLPRFAGEDKLAARHPSKIKQVVVPWASRRPLPSVMRPSAVPTRRPRLSTMPSARISPVSGVIGAPARS